MNESNESQSTRGWDTYWKGTRDAEAYAAGGVSHPTVKSFWDSALNDFFVTRKSSSILDIATGSGAVVERLAQNNATGQHEVTCVDISAAAIDGVRDRYPEVTGVVADANSIPLESSRYDLVTSQFGIEYAGLTALDEAARLLAPAGSLIVLMHVRPGVIFLECTVALDAIRRTQSSGFVALAVEFFEAGFAAVRGADRLAYDEAAKRLNPAIQELETLFSRYGQQVAGGTIASLYTDVQRIHGRIQYYEAGEVLAWLQNMGKELTEYEERMASMCDAAINDETFDGVCENLVGHGLQIIRAEPLPVPDAALPIAWILRADRPN